MQGPSPADPHPMKGFPQIRFIKSAAKNLAITTGADIDALCSAC